MTLRLYALAAAVAAIALAAPGQAAPRPQVVDPRGDALSSDPGVDIVSGTFSTKGTTTTKKVRGKRVTTYTPTDLVIAVELAGPPTKQQGTTLHVVLDVEGCGLLDISHSPATATGGTRDSAYVECAGDPDNPTDTSSIVDLNPKIAGNTITWTMKLRMFGKEVGPGSVLSDLRVYTAPVEPVMGVLDTGSLPGGVAFDTATGDEYVIG